MRTVSRLVRRAIAVLLAAPFLTLASALAPQHIHEPGPGRDHDHAVAHSHFGPHGLGVHHADDTEIEHDDFDHGHVVWLDSPILPESSYQPARVLPAIPASVGTVPAAELRWSVTSFDAAAPVHGPPKRAHLLRGPPLPRLS
jgi:hypothetical protein